MYGPRVVYLESAAQEGVVELERRAREDRNAFRVDQDLEVARLDHDVVARGRLLERQLVAEPGAPTGNHADPQVRFGEALAMSERRGFGRSLVRYGKDLCVGGAIHVSMIALGTMAEPMISPKTLEESLRPRLEARPAEEAPDDAELAAVLVPVLAASPQPRLVFTKRSDTLSRHAGEISFPGGLADSGENPAATALREAEEELGLLPTDVELLGALPPVHTRVTGILIVPFVGLLRKDPAFTPNAAEIADVLEFPIPHLVAAAGEREFEHEGMTFQTLVFELNGHVIWGATARILSSFLELLETTEAR